MRFFIQDALSPAIKKATPARWPFVKYSVQQQLPMQGFMQGFLSQQGSGQQHMLLLLPQDA